jgi:hypothetical protein
LLRYCVREGASEPEALEGCLPVTKCLPGLGQPDLAVANPVVQEALKLVLNAGTELALVGLGPEVLGRARRAADRERDQVVFLVMAEGLVLEAVVRDALDLEVVGVARRRPNRVGPVRDADVLLDAFLLDVRVERSGGALEVGQTLDCLLVRSPASE